MTDLTRLRDIVLSGDLKTIFVGTSLYHLSPDPSSSPRVGIEEAREAVSWLGRAPGVFYGDVVSSTGVVPGDFASAADEMNPSQLAAAATLANAMATPDRIWDRGTRSHLEQALITHSADAARHSAQSSAEFAAIDAMSAAGYATDEHARTALAELRRAYGVHYRVHTRQHARSRVAISMAIRLPDQSIARVLTPWCLSRTSAMIFAAVVLAPQRRAQLHERATNLSLTAMSYAERRGLDAVRAILEPAIALLTYFKYDPVRLAFVDQYDRERQPITTRDPAALLAFACIHMCGASDALMRLAQLRYDAAPVIDPPPAHVVEYTEEVNDESSALLFFSRSLHASRAWRDASGPGPRLNKDPMLGYIARGQSRVERNTAACINRVEETVAVLRSRGVDVLRTLFVVEWGGDFDYPAVLASLAISRLDSCVDIGPASIDIPGADVLAEADESSHHYALLLSSAEARGLPRMPLLPYPSHEPLPAKLKRLYQFYSPSGHHNIAYISGGNSHEEGTPVNICIDSNARLAAVREATPDVAISFACAEVLLPPLCAHGAAADPATYLQTSSLIDEECPLCNAHYRSIAVVSSALSMGDTRIVKPRSMYAHNAHVSMELLPGYDNCLDDTLLTIDSMLAANLTRNAPYESVAVTPPGGGNPTNPEVRDTTASLLRAVYGLLSNGATGPYDYDDMASIAASIPP